MLAFDLDKSAIDALVGNLPVTEEQQRKAGTSALRKFRKRFETRIKRAVAKKARIPLKGLENRFFSSRVEEGDQELTVWIGAWNVSPFAIGVPVPYGVPGKSGGVKAGRHRWRGAFIQAIYSGESKVWIRASSKHFSPELYPTNYRPGDRGLAGDGRFPVVRAAISVDAAIEQVLATEGPQLVGEFEKIFQQELNYYAVVKGD